MSLIIPNPAIFFCGAKVRKYSSVGGYPLFYLTRENSVLSAEAVQGRLAECCDPEDMDFVTACGVNWEDSDLCCDDTGERIESAYAEDDRLEGVQS